MKKNAIQFIFHGISHRNKSGVVKSDLLSDLLANKKIDYLHNKNE